MTRRLTAALVILSAIVAAPIAGYAAVIYDNGPYSEAGGGEASARAFADDFVLAAAAVAQGARLIVREGTAASWDQSTLTWYIFADGGTAPGLLIDSGPAVNIQVTNLGPGIFGRDLLDVAFNFDSAVALAGSTGYWFGLHFGNTFFVNDVQWLMSTSTFGDAAAQTLTPPSGPWTSSAADLNFRLLDTRIPEPATLFLTLLGLALIRRSRA